MLSLPQKQSLFSGPLFFPLLLQDLGTNPTFSSFLLLLLLLLLLLVEVVVVVVVLFYFHDRLGVDITA